MIRILHLADLHLGRSHSYLGDKAAERKKEADGVLRRIVDRVLGDPIEVGAVVIAGDLFETYKPEDALVGETIGQLRRFVEAGKTVVTLPGNHDELSYHDCVYNKHRNRWPGILVTSPEWIKVATVESPDGPCHFYGITYQAGVTTEDLDTTIPLEDSGLHVGVLHAAVDLPGRDRSIRAKSRQLGDLGVDYVALGHVHKPGEFRLPRGLAVYPGLIEGSGFDDPGRGELTIVTLGDGAPKVEKISLDARRIEARDLDLSSVDDPDTIRRTIEELADPDLILEIRLTGAAGFEPPVELICSELADRFYHLEVEEDYTLIDAADIDAAARDETPLGITMRKLRERVSEATSERDRAVANLAIQHAWRAWRGGAG